MNKQLELNDFKINTENKISNELLVAVTKKLKMILHQNQN
jgi:hypothetical protein